MQRGEQQLHALHQSPPPATHAAREVAVEEVTDAAREVAVLLFSGDLSLLDHHLLLLCAS
jgi:hypothetical protein